MFECWRWVLVWWRRCCPDWFGGGARSDWSSRVSNQLGSLASRLPSSQFCTFEAAEDRSVASAMRATSASTCTPLIKEQSKKAYQMFSPKSAAHYTFSLWRAFGSSTHHHHQICSPFLQIPNLSIMEHLEAAAPGSQIPANRHRPI